MALTQNALITHSSRNISQSPNFNVLKGLGHAILGNFCLILPLWALKVKLAEQESFICKIKAT